MLRVPDLNVGFESIVLMLGLCQLLALMQFVDVLMHFVLSLHIVTVPSLKFLTDPAASAEVCYGESFGLKLAIVCGCVWQVCSSWRIWSTSSFLSMRDSHGM